MSAELLRELARAQALFQARAIAAVMGLPLPTELDPKLTLPEHAALSRLLVSEKKG